MSTAKSMASSYLNGKRAAKFKSSACNLSSGSSGGGPGARLKSTSMTNLNQREPASQQPQAGRAPMQRPASRNALDSIHNGMNARYAQVQSKVYLQNIKAPAAGASRIPASPRRAATLSRAPGGGAKTSASGQAAALQARLAQLEERLRLAEAEAEAGRQELERERQQRQQQVERLKQELEEKAAQAERQSEEQHRKLLEAYELADQNRRSADSLLAESRQRDEEARKRRQELERQLEELREFVQLREEMAGKMVELREQLREERERYEQQLANLGQVFENEKISKDENCNYFSPKRPLAESADSLGPGAQVAPGCRKCRGGRSQLHRSEQDMYGSRVSTRVQESARSAWRASKQFASSIITGGVSLSACRQLRRPRKGKRKEEEVAQQQQQQHLQLPLPPARSPRAARAAAARGAEEAPGGTEEEELHTSVVRVEVAPAGRRPEAPEDSKIHVDPQSNKLTIVTKFTGAASPASSATTSPSGERRQSPESGAVSSSSSDRSRCESSSSGRGTSAASDDAQSTGEAAAPEAADAKLAVAGSQAKAEAPVERRHRRRSSLFKASKVLGAGSQTSLNKLRSFFAVSSSASANISADKAQPMEHLESSRRRCLELARQPAPALEVCQGGPDADQQS